MKLQQTRFAETDKQFVQGMVLDYATKTIHFLGLKPTRKNNELLARKIAKKFPFVSGTIRYTKKTLTVIIH